MRLSFRPQIYDESETDQILNAKYYVWKNYTLGKWALREAFNRNSLMQLFNGDRRIVQSHGQMTQAWGHVLNPPKNSSRGGTLIKSLYTKPIFQGVSESTLGLLTGVSAVTGLAGALIFPVARFTKLELFTFHAIITNRTCICSVLRKLHKS